MEPTDRRTGVVRRDDAHDPDREAIDGDAQGSKIVSSEHEDDADAEDDEDDEDDEDEDDEDVERCLAACSSNCVKSLNSFRRSLIRRAVSSCSKEGGSGWEGKGGMKIWVGMGVVSGQGGGIGAHTSAEPERAR